MTARRTATVWSSTWVPSASPIVGYGADGYAACWVDLDDGARAQVLVDGEPPTPGTGGRIEERWYGDERVDLFCRAEA